MPASPTKEPSDVAGPNVSLRHVRFAEHGADSVKPDDGNKFSLTETDSDAALSKKVRRNTVSTEQAILVLSQLEMKLNWKISALGLLLETLQLIGLVLNPRLQWGEGFGDVAGKVLYSTVFPIFDTRWVNANAMVACIFFWLFWLGLASIIATVIYFLFQRYHSMSFVIGAVVKMTAHAASSIGLLPIALAFMSFIVCDSHDERMFWIPSHKCRDAFSFIYMGFGIVGLLMLASVVWVVNMLLLDDKPDSKSLTARPTVLVVSSNAAMRLLSAIMFSVLLSRDLQQIFAIAYCVLCIVQALMYAVFLPYYRLRLNQFRVAQLLAVASFAGVAAADIPTTNAWHRKNISTIVTLLVALLASVVGWHLCRVRINRACERSIKKIQDGALSRQTVSQPTFPKGLLEDELFLSRFPKIDSLMSSKQEHTDSADQGVDGETVRTNESASGRDELSVLDPYISAIYSASDVELSTRFLSRFLQCSGLPEPTPRMRLFAARLYTKGMVKFREDPDVVYNFCMFLVVYGRQFKLALHELMRLQRTGEGVSISLRYRIHRLVGQLKMALNISNDVQLQFVAACTDVHYQLLDVVSSFWGQLSSGSQSGMELMATAELFTLKREVAKQFYSTALREPSEELLVNYAKFLREFMMDEETAKMLEDRIADQVELQRQCASGTAAGPDLRRNKDAFDWKDCMMQVRDAKAVGRSQKYNTDGSGRVNGNMARYLRFFMYPVLLLAFLIWVGLVVNIGVSNVQIGTVTKHIRAATSERDLLSSVSMKAIELQHVLLSPTAPGMADVVAGFQAVFGEEAEKFFTHHMLIMSRRAKWESVYEYLSNPHTEVVEPATDSIEGNYALSVTSFFDLGLRIHSALKAINTTTSISPNDDNLLFIVLNANYTFSQAASRLVELLVNERDTIIGRAGLVQICLVAATLMMLFLALTVLLVYLNRNIVTKASIISLFTLIPHNYVVELSQASKERALRVGTKGRCVMTPTSHDSLSFGSQPAVSPPLGQGRRETSASESNPLVVLSFAEPEIFPESDEVSSAPQAGGSEKGAGFMQLEDNGSDEEGVLATAATSDTHGNDSLSPDVDELNGAGDDQQRHSPYWLIDQALIITGKSSTAIIALGICFAVGIIAFILTCLLVNTSNSLQHASATYQTFLQNSAYYHDVLSSLGENAQQYILTGDIVYVQRYYNYIVETDYERMLTDGVLKEPNPNTGAAVSRIRSVINSALQRQQIAIWLASLYYKVPASQKVYFTRIYAIQRPYDYVALESVIESVFGVYNPVKGEPSASTDATDAARPPDEQYAIAVNLVFDDYYYAHGLLIEDTLKQMMDSEVSETTPLYRLQTQYWKASLALYIVFIVLLLFNVLVFYRKKGVGFMLLVLLLSLAASIASCVVLILASGSKDNVNDLQTYYSNLIRAHANTSITLQANRANALRIALYGYPSTVANWEREAEGSALSGNALDLLLAFTHAQSEVSDAEGTSVAVVQFFKYAKYVQHFATIAASLAISAYSLPISPLLKGFIYNRQLEPNFVEEYLVFGKGTCNYDNIVDDAKLSKEEKLARSKCAVSGPRYEFVVRELFLSMHNLIAFIRSSVTQRLSKLEDDVHLYTTLAKWILLVAVGLIPLALLIAVYAWIMGDHNPSVLAAKGRFITSSAYPRGTLFGLFLFIVVALILIALLPLTFFSGNAERGTSYLLSVTKERDWAFLDTCIYALKLWYQSPIGDYGASPIIVPLAKRISNSLTTRNAVFLGTDKGFGGVLGSSERLGIDLFGPHDYSRKENMVECTVYKYEQGSSVKDFGRGTDNVTELLMQLFSNGYENAYWQILELTLEVMINPDFDLTDDVHASFLTLIPNLTERLHATSNVMADYQMKVNKSYLIVIIVLLALVIIGLLLLLWFIHRVSRHLIQEEEGIELLLRMIPEEVKQRVPAIAEFIETGKVNDTAERITEACQSFETSMLVVVDDRDTILRITQEVARYLDIRASDVVGSKVDVLFAEGGTMLSPERYRHENGRSIFSDFQSETAWVRCVRSDGTILPMSIHVRPVCMNLSNSGVTNHYVLSFRCNLMDSSIETASLMRDCLLEIGRYPQILLNPRGCVVVANKAAVRLFGDTVLDTQPVTMHDILNASSAETFDKVMNNLVNSAVSHIGRCRVTGVGRNGEAIPLEVVLRPVFDDDDKLVYCIVNVQDLIPSQLVERHRLVMDTVMDCSPIPVIIFDTNGNITFFSRAAERCWDVSAVEVVGHPFSELLSKEEMLTYDFTYGSKSDLKYFLNIPRVLKGRRRDGKTFPIEVTLRELGRTVPVTIIGYFKNLSQELDVLQQNILSQVAFDRSPVATFTVDELGIIKAFNNAAQRMFGLSPEQVIGQGIAVLMPKAVAQQRMEVFQRCLETGDTTALKEKHTQLAQRADGRVFSVEWQMTEITVRDTFNETGAQRLFVGFVRDTDEQQMRKANELSDVVIQMCPVVTLSFDERGIILTANTAAEQLFLVPLTNIAGRNIGELIPEVRSGQVSWVSSGTNDTVRDVHALQAGGAMIPVELHIRAVTKVTLARVYVATIHDINAKSAKLNEHNVMHASINMHPQSIIVVNHKGTIRFLSDEAVKTFGYAREMIVGRNATVLMGYNDEHKRDALLSEMLLKDSTVPAETAIAPPMWQLQMACRDGFCFSARVRTIRLRQEVAPKGTESYGMQPDNTSYEVLTVFLIEDLTHEGMLQQSTSLRDTMFTHFDFGAAVVSDRGVIRYASPVFLRVFGFDSENDVLEKHMSLAFPPCVVNEHRKLVDSYNRDSVGLPAEETVEVEAARVDGARLYLQLVMRGVRDETENFITVVLLRDITDEVCARNRERLVKELFDSSSVPLLLVNSDEGDTAEECGVVITSNTALERMLQYERGGVVGMHVDRLCKFPSDTSTSILRFLRESLQAGSVAPTVAVGIRQDGESVPIRLSMAETIHTESGRPAMLITLEDITMQLRQQTELDVSATAMSLSPLAVVCMDGDGHIVLFSRLAERLFGHREVDVLGRHVSMLMPSDATISDNEFLRFFSAGAQTHLSSKPVLLRRQVGRRADYTLFPVEISLYEASNASVMSPRGDRLIVSLFRDTLQDPVDAIAGHLSRMTLRSLALPFIVVSITGIIEELNEALASAFGYRRDELVGRSVKMLMSPEVARAHDGYVHRYMDSVSTGSGTTEAQVLRYVTGRHSYGHTTPFEVTVGHHMNPELHTVSLYAFLRDMSEEVRGRTECLLSDIIVELEGNSVLLVDGHGQIMRASKTAAQLFGYPVDTVLHRLHIGEVLPTMLAFNKFIRNCSVSGGRHGTFTGEWTNMTVMEGVRNDGKSFLCALRVQQLPFGNGSVAYACLVTDPTRAMVHRDMPQMADAINALSLVGVIVVNEASAITHVNDRAARLFGYESSAELVGQSVEVLQLAQSGTTTISAAPSISHRIAGRRRDGTSVLVDRRVVEHVDAAQGRQLVLYVQDLSHVVEGENTESAAQSMLSLIPVATVVISQDATVLQASRAAEDAFGAPSEVFVGKKLNVLLYPIDSDAKGTEGESAGNILHHTSRTSTVLLRRTIDGGHPRMRMTVTELAGDNEWQYYLCFFYPMM